MASGPLALAKAAATYFFKAGISCRRTNNEARKSLDA
jgi:hypothetical protein